MPEFAPDARVSMFKVRKTKVGGSLARRWGVGWWGGRAGWVGAAPCPEVAK